MHKEHKELSDNLIQQLLDNLPTGGPFDCCWNIKRNYKYVLCSNSIHCMNEYGFYDGFVEFTVKMPITKEHVYGRNDFILVAHGWKSYTTKKYWPIYLDYIEQVLLNNLQVVYRFEEVNDAT